MSDKGSGDVADLAREEMRTIRYEGETAHRSCGGRCCVTPEEYR